MGRNYDFGGWATRHDLECSDGLTIRKGAFESDNGKTVPLVWQHQHNDPDNVLGHALLENRPEGVYAYCTFNDTKAAQTAKMLVQHGDITALSIYANKLQKRARDVMHGTIREVSLVIAGANPGASIDFPRIAHADGEYEYAEDEAVIYTDETIAIAHAEDSEEEKIKKEEKPVAKEEANEKTVQDVFDTLNEEQKTVVYYLLGKAIEGKDTDEDESDERDNEMKHNVFDGQNSSANNYLAHSDEMAIISTAKKSGSFRQAYEAYVEENYIQHDDDPADVSGFGSYPSGDDPAAIDALFPEWHDVRPGAPELVTDDLSWVQVVLRKVHKSPFSRIRTSQVDIRSIDSLRAKGYQKGTKKGLAGNYSLVRRTTDPQTIYVKSALNRDDIVDITDFDYVAYQYKIDRMQLEEELATAILLGDGRVEGTDGKIEESHIRPIWTDDDLYTIHKNLDLTAAAASLNGNNTSDNFGENFITSEAMVSAMLDAMIDYRGSGSLDMFCTQQFVNKMLLARDLNGRRIYNTKAELATALGVNAIYPVSKMANKTRTKGSGGGAKTMLLDAIIVNLNDYSVGSTKGGEITHFNQFDIDFNQEKSLLETRVSGANTRIYSAIVIEEEVSNP